MIVLGLASARDRRIAVAAVGNFPAHGHPGLHCTWLVNSATHSWGTRRFATRDLSTNSWWVALLTYGEGWHNNHHAHPVSARHGLRWYEIDMNWYGIWTLKKLGLAKNIYSVKLSELENKNEPAPEEMSEPELASV